MIFSMIILVPMESITTRFFNSHFASSGLSFLLNMIVAVVITVVLFFIPFILYMMVHSHIAKRTTTLCADLNIGSEKMSDSMFLAVGTSTISFIIAAIAALWASLKTLMYGIFGGLEISEIFSSMPSVLIAYIVAFIAIIMVQVLNYLFYYLIKKEGKRTTTNIA